MKRISILLFAVITVCLLSAIIHATEEYTDYNIYQSALFELNPDEEAYYSTNGSCYHSSEDCCGNNYHKTRPIGLSEQKHGLSACRHCYRYLYVQWDEACEKGLDLNGFVQFINEYPSTAPYFNEKTITIGKLTTSNKPNGNTLLIKYGTQWVNLNFKEGGLTKDTDLLEITFKGIYTGINGSVMHFSSCEITAEEKGVLRNAIPDFTIFATLFPLLIVLLIVLILVFLNTRKKELQTPKESKVYLFPMSMRWYNFYVYVRFPIGFVLNAFIIAGLTGKLFPGHSEASSTLKAELEVTGVIVGLVASWLALSILTYIQMVRFSRIAYKANNMCLVADPALGAIILSLNIQLGNFVNDSGEVSIKNFILSIITILITVGCAWFIPNFIYFKKRRGLFDPAYYPKSTQPSKTVGIESEPAETSTPAVEIIETNDTKEDTEIADPFANNGIIANPQKVFSEIYEKYIQEQCCDASCKHEIDSYFYAIAKKQKREIKNFKKTYSQLELMVIKVLYNITFDMVTSGKYHIFRGVLLPEGEKIRDICLLCLDYYLENRYITKEQCDEQRKLLRKGISEIG